MTVLALTMLSIYERQTAPTVSYGTALDYYYIVAYMFCFSAMIEFAVVNHVTMIHPRTVIAGLEKGSIVIAKRRRPYRSNAIIPRSGLIHTAPRLNRDTVLSENGKECCAILPDRKSVG